MARRGKPSELEYQQIDSMIDDGMSDEQIAKTIDRTTAIVASRRNRHTPVEKRATDNECLARLHGKSMWIQIQKQLNKDELALFEEQWVALNDQFSIQGVLMTEEISMKDLIIMEILCNRNLIDRKRIADSIDFYQILLKQEQEKPFNDRDIEQMQSWRDTINGMRGATESLTKDYKEYVQRKGAILKELKGTREQRLKTIENSEKDIFSLIKILDEPEMRRMEGEELMVLRLAVANQRKRLKDLYKYADGKYDRPLLRPEDIIEDVNAENKEEQDGEK